MCHLALRIARFRLLSALSVACHYASLSSQNCPFRPSQCLVSTLSLRVTTTAQWAILRAKRRLSLRFMVLKNRKIQKLEKMKNSKNRKIQKIDLRKNQILIKRKSVEKTSILAVFVQGKRRLKKTKGGPLRRCFFENR